MEKINNSINSRNLIMQDNQNNTLNPYNNLKNAYLDFTKQMSKSDFANSPRRYIIELNLVKELKNLSEENDNKEDYEFWNKKQEEIEKALLQWGIEID